MRRSRCILLLVLLLAGCQQPLSHHFRDEVFPQDTASKVALSPVLLPFYLLLTVTDAFVVNPVRGAANVPKMAGDLWSWKNDTAWLGYGVLLPVKLIATPPAVIGTTIFSEQFKDPSGGK